MTKVIGLNNSTEEIVENFRPTRVVFVTDKDKTEEEVFKQFQMMLSFLNYQASEMPFPKFSVISIKDFSNTNLRLVEAKTKPQNLSDHVLEYYDQYSSHVSTAIKSVYVIDIPYGHDEAELDKRLDKTLFDLELHKKIGCKVYFYTRDNFYVDYINDKTKNDDYSQCIFDNILLLLFKAGFHYIFNTFDTKKITKQLKEIGDGDLGLQELWSFMSTLNYVLNYQMKEDDVTFSYPYWEPRYTHFPSTNGEYMILLSLLSAMAYLKDNNENLYIQKDIPNNYNIKSYNLTTPFTKSDGEWNIMSEVCNGLIVNLIKLIQKPALKDSTGLFLIQKHEKLRLSKINYIKYSLKNYIKQEFNFIIKSILPDERKVNYSKRTNFPYWLDTNFNLNVDDTIFKSTEMIENRVITITYEEYHNNFSAFNYVKNYYILAGYIIINYLSNLIVGATKYANNEIEYEEFLNYVSNGNSINIEEYFNRYTPLKIDTHKNSFISNIEYFGELLKKEFPYYISIVYRTFVIDHTGKRMGDRFALLIKGDSENPNNFEWITHHFMGHKSYINVPIISESKGVILIK